MTKPKNVGIDNYNIKSCQGLSEVPLNRVVKQKLNLMKILPGIREVIESFKSYVL